MNSKRLHLHALPVAILTTGLVYVSIFALSHLIVTNTNNTNSLSALIGAHLYDIKPASNGFFHISRSFTTVNTQVSAQSAVQNDSTIGETFMTGQATELQAALNQAGATQVSSAPSQH
jgi:hypothetical protein